jgi:hypothetical protein
MSSSNRRSFGLDESFPPQDQKWRSSTTSNHSPEKSESRLTTGDTGEILHLMYSIINSFRNHFI